MSFQISLKPYYANGDDSGISFYDCFFSLGLKGSDLLYFYDPVNARGRWEGGYKAFVTGPIKI